MTPRTRNQRRAAIEKMMRSVPAPVVETPDRTRRVKEILPPPVQDDDDREYEAWQLARGLYHSDW
jgi:hypothetical protein